MDRTVPMMTLVCFLCLLISMSESKRPVIKIGTTFPPDFKRPPDGKLLQKCPEKYPHAFNDRKHCCRVETTKNDTSLAPDCNGGPIKYTTSLACCFKDLYVECTDHDRRCNHWPKKPCYPYPKLIYHDVPYFNLYSLYHPNNVRKFVQCEVHGQNYYLANDYRRNQKLIYDFGCETSITMLELRNTQNGFIKDRGIRNFSFEESYDNTNWRLVLADVLPRVAYANACQIPTHQFPIAAHGRFFRLTMVDYYGLGAGLNYINWVYS